MNTNMEDLSGVELISDWIWNCRLGDLSECKLYYEELRRRGMNSLSSLDDGNTGLHYAAANGHLDVIDFLLSLPEAEHRENEYKSTPLMWAVVNGHCEAVEKILRHDISSANKIDKKFYVDVCSVNNAGRSALAEGFLKGDDAIVQLLLAHPSGASIEHTMVDTTDKDGMELPSSASEMGLDDEEHENLCVQDQDGRERFVASSVVSAPIGGGKKIYIRQVDTEPENGILLEGDLGNDLQTMNDRTGFYVWRASIVGFEWLVKLIESGDLKISGASRILELGAGCGFWGIGLCGHLSGLINECIEFDLTDINPLTVKNLLYNIEYNLRVCGLNKIRGGILDWRKIPSERWDIIFGSDLVYTIQGGNDLGRLVTNILSRPHGRFYLTYGDERAGMDELRKILFDNGLKMIESVAEDTVGQIELIKLNATRFEDCNDKKLNRTNLAVFFWE